MKEPRVISFFSVVWDWYPNQGLLIRHNTILNLKKHWMELVFFLRIRKRICYFAGGGTYITKTRLGISLWQRIKLVQWIRKRLLTC